MPEYLNLVWRDRVLRAKDGEQRQILEVTKQDGTVLGQVLCTRVEYKPEISAISLLTATMLVEDARITSHGAPPEN